MSRTAAGVATAIVVAASMLALSASPVLADPGDLTFFVVPASDADGPREATDITLGPDGNVWFLATSETGAEDVLGTVTSQGAITTFPLEGSGDGHLVTGPDGRLWIASDALYKVRADGTVVAKGRPGSGQYDTIVAGPRGHLWLLIGAKVKELDRSGRVLRTFRLPHTADDLAMGPDGNLWATWTFGGVDRLTPSGVVTTFPSLGFGTAQPDDLQGIIAGPDGKLWAVAHFESPGPQNFARVCKISTSGRFRCYVGPNGVHAIAVGPDDALYVDRSTRFDLNPDRVDPPALERYEVNGDSSAFVDPGLHDIRAITSGADDDVWFTQDPGESGATLGRLEVAPPTG